MTSSFVSTFSTNFLVNHILQGTYPNSVVATYLVEAISDDGVGAVDIAAEYLFPDNLEIVLGLAMSHAARHLKGDVVLALQCRGVAAELDQNDEIEVDECSDGHGWHDWCADNEASAEEYEEWFQSLDALASQQMLAVLTLDPLEAAG
jgi:hypothetical protein